MIKNLQLIEKNICSHNRGVNYNTTRRHIVPKNECQSIFGFSYNEWFLEKETSQIRKRSFCVCVCGSIGEVVIILMSSPHFKLVLLRVQVRGRPVMWECLTSIHLTADTECVRDLCLYSYSKLLQIVNEFFFISYKTIHLTSPRVRMLAGITKMHTGIYITECWALILLWTWAVWA